ncbi:MAG: C39 family peptidase [Candidatus Levybacteria bacterium]|nr:C39 family peptidase [Candidatus Levybacteria bacterium]
MENTADKTSEAILAGTGISFLLLVSFFSALFYSQNKQSNILSSTPKSTYSYSGQVVQQSKRQVLSLSVQNTEEVIPSTYTIPFDARKQIFNLSCEFAAAASIIYHFTKDPTFSELNEKTAEETLVKKVGVSQNPNIGVRMGVNEASEEAILYENLNKRFGGTDYYGVHAPPFIELFATYGFVAEPIGRGNDDKIKAIARSVSVGRPVMAWIQIGRGNPIDVALAYDTTPIVRGEHVVVIHGYNENGVFVMDPGTGGFRHVPYKDLLIASSSFRMPFLSVFQGVAKEVTTIESVGVDSITGLNRNRVRITVLNGSGREADASEMMGILEDFGYSVVRTGNADNASYENVTLSYKPKIKDYIKLLQRDLSLAMYNVASFSAALDSDDKEDVVLIVGK